MSQMNLRHKMLETSLSRFPDAATKRLASDCGHASVLIDLGQSGVFCFVFYQEV